jgi:hypothetical protein
VYKIRLPKCTGCGKKVLHAVFFEWKKKPPLLSRGFFLNFTRIYSVIYKLHRDLISLQVNQRVPDK